MPAGLRAGIPAPGRAGYGAATGSGPRPSSPVSAAGSGRSARVGAAAAAFKNRFRIVRQVAGKPGDFGAAVEDLAVHGLARQRRADDRRQACRRPWSPSPRGWRAPRRAPAPRRGRRRSGRARWRGATSRPRIASSRSWSPWWSWSALVAAKRMRSMRRLYEPAQPVGAAETEGAEDGGERGLEIGDGDRPGVQRGQRIDHDDLPVEAGEVIAEEGAHDGDCDRTRSGAPSCGRASRSVPRRRRRGAAARR